MQNPSIKSFRVYTKRKLTMTVHYGSLVLNLLDLLLEFPRHALRDDTVGHETVQQLSPLLHADLLILQHKVNISLENI